MQQPAWRGDWSAHPLCESTKEPLATPAVVRMFPQAMRALRTGLSGRYFVGAHRDGITRTLFALQSMVERAIPGVVTAYHSFSRGKRADPLRHAYLSFLQSGNCTLLTGKTEDLRIRASQRFVSAGRVSPKPLIILLADNVQDSVPEDVLAVDDLRHELARNGISLTVLAAGHSLGMRTWIDNMSSGGIETSVRKQLAGIELPFTPIASRADLKAILALIDTTTSDDTGETWTSFFLPQQTARGFLLANEVGNFVGCLGSQENVNRIFSTGIPQGAFFDSVRLYLDSAAENDGGIINEEMKRAFWATALHDSGFFDLVEDKALDGVRNGSMPEPCEGQFTTTGEA
ncbi:hypothetical protein [Paraburkholderia sp. RL17-337-BIB-A]|uniref:hypothetical protein n=1 Tax=Paraburkholderia sp. RL17-337-BIB-A TaxID=3031636 RepID=UPI0038BCB91F